MKVIIDGENFRHQIARILVEEGLLEKTNKNDYFRFDLAGFLDDIIGSTDRQQIYYYTTRIKRPAYKIPKKLADNLEKISVSNRKWIAQLVNQKIIVVKAGNLKVRESNACVHCGKKTLILQEKGVDVRVATDLLLAAADKQQIILISSDSDLVPSLRAASKMGGIIMYICPANKVNRSLVAHSDKVVTFDKDKVLKYFRG